MGSRIRDTARYLFELFCEVSPGDHTRDPYIIKKYPESYNHEEELRNIPKFTFPCQLDNLFAQHYSYVLTSLDSKYTFCFCRFDPKTNTTLVLLTHLPWHDIFYKLLNCIGNLMTGPEQGELYSFLEACRIRPPMAGHTLKVTYNAGHSAFACQCPDDNLPSIPENCNLTEYFSAMDSGCMAGLWAALLHERRVAIVASKLSRLSACVQAANATLFPMSWQHIFIPILPKHLVDYLLAPMPFLIGVPRTVMENVRLSDIGDVVILDVDENELKSPFRDLESLPPDLVASLKKALSDKNALGDAVSRAFLRALVCLIGGYRDAIKIENGQLITFNPEAFVKTRKNMQPFLTKILQSQIFQQFIEERLELLNSGRGFSDEFELECSLYADRVNMAGGRAIKHQYRDWAKNVKKEGGAFFKTVKDKVRQGGKNMKTAVKGLKNKMPRTGSRPSSINTTDDSRYSYGSATPVSSDSSESSPAHGEAPASALPSAGALPLDLLNEMEYLFANQHDPRRDTLPPDTSQRGTTLQEKAKTLSPCVPPRLAERPHVPSRYPIISTRRLVELSGAPTPPPRASAGGAPSYGAHEPLFVSNITKHAAAGAQPLFHTTTLSFEGSDKPNLKLTISSNQRRPRPPPAAPLAPRAPLLQESRDGSECDLIKLDVTPNELEEFDPLMSRVKARTEPMKTSTDSALLHEYGLDFSRFGIVDVTPGCSSRPLLPDTRSPVPKGWTTFN